MNFTFNLKHSLTELQLILGIKDVEGTYLPSQQMSHGDDIPVVFDNKIRVFKWNPIFNGEIIQLNQVSHEMFQDGLFRCVVPMNSFYYTDRFSHKFHFYKKGNSIFFGIAIANKNGEFDFVMVHRDEPIPLFSPLFLSTDDFNLWIGDAWNSIKEGCDNDLFPLYHNILDNTQMFFPFNVDFSLDKIKESREKLNARLKKISPKIDQII